MAVVPKQLPVKLTDETRRQTALFEALFLEHWPRVYGVLVRLVGDPAEAEDLALEVFWQLYQRPPHNHLNLGGWLYRVALNLGYNALRAAQRRTRHEEQAGREWLEATSTNPEAETERTLDRQRVQAVLKAMPLREAHLLVLKHSGFSYKEIADMLKVAPTSVGTLLARAEAEFAQRFVERHADDSHH